MVGSTKDGGYAVIGTRVRVGKGWYILCKLSKMQVNAKKKKKSDVSSSTWIITANSNLYAASALFGDGVKVQIMLWKKDLQWVYSCS